MDIADVKLEDRAIPSEIHFTEPTRTLGAANLYVFPGPAQCFQIHGESTLGMNRLLNGVERLVVYMEWGSRWVRFGERRVVHLRETVLAGALV